MLEAYFTNAKARFAFTINPELPVGRTAAHTMQRRAHGTGIR